MPVTSAPGIRSFIRLRQRISVLLPQPDGPIRAVISFTLMSKEMSRTAGVAAVAHAHVLDAEDGLAGPSLAGRAPSSAGAATSTFDLSGLRARRAVSMRSSSPSLRCSVICSATFGHLPLLLVAIA